MVVPPIHRLASAGRSNNTAALQVGVSSHSEAAGRFARAAGGGLPQVLPVCGGPGCPRHLAHSLLHMGRYWSYQVGPFNEF